MSLGLFIYSDCTCVCCINPNGFPNSATIKFIFVRIVLFIFQLFIFYLLLFSGNFFLTGVPELVFQIRTITAKLGHIVSVRTHIQPSV